MDNANESAYPTAVPDVPEAHVGGLTKRERFAMAAMQGMISDMHHNDNNQPHQIAHDSVAYADALLTELNQ